MPRSTRGRQEARRKTLKMILRRRRARTQSDLVGALKERGFEITQSSLSRDLTHLGARKADGTYRLPGDSEPSEEGEPVHPTLAELQPFVRGVRPAGTNLLVVATRPGLAQTVALALDSMAMPEVVGTIAGDDIVFVAIPSRRAQRSLERRFERIFAGQPSD